MLSSASYFCFLLDFFSLVYIHRGKQKYVHIYWDRYCDSESAALLLKEVYGRVFHVCLDDICQNKKSAVVLLCNKCLRGVSLELFCVYSHFIHSMFVCFIDGCLLFEWNESKCWRKNREKITDKALLMQKIRFKWYVNPFKANAE